MYIYKSRYDIIDVVYKFVQLTEVPSYKYLLYFRELSLDDGYFIICVSISSLIAYLHNETRVRTWVYVYMCDTIIISIFLTA